MVLSNLPPVSPVKNSYWGRLPVVSSLSATSIPEAVSHIRITAAAARDNSSGFLVLISVPYKPCAARIVQHH